ncbi:MAG: GntR family transcriptional regulator [Deltaproteobacteria bacterium]|nr:GntR family transcriptional regulator [Deltaproteobacteria bacterium]
MKNMITHNGAPPKRGAAIEETFQKIRNMLYSSLLAPGQKIIYTDLARRLNVSVTPVIQALNRLKASGFVTYAPNKGYFVSEITEQEALQLYEAREALEIYIIPRIVENLNPRVVSQFKKTFKKHSMESENLIGRRLILVDAHFHLKIAEFAANEVIYTMLEEIFEKLYLKYRPEYFSNEQILGIVQEHRALLDALSRGEAQEAIAATRRHIASGRARVINSLRIRQAPDILLGGVREVTLGKVGM